MKKALIVANLFGFCGFLLNDILTLQSMGYQVDFAADGTGATEENLTNLTSRGVRIFDVKCSSKNPFDKKNISAYFSLRKILKDGEYDLVHCHTPIIGFFARLAAAKYRKKGVKVIYTTHGLSFTHLSSKKQWFLYYNFEKFASRFTDAIITINREDFANAKTFRCKNVYMINGVGVDIERYHNVHVDVEEYKRKLGIPLEKIVVLSVGELSARKNHRVIIRALAKLPNKEDYVFVICGKEVGNSGVAADLQALADEKGVGLLLLGHRRDIPEIMHLSDIGAIPSVREGLGLAGIQSLAAGVPLVGSSVQGIQDYILPGNTGFLYEPFDVDGFAEGIVKLSDLFVREAMRENCYQMAWEYDVKISKQQMQEIYHGIIMGEK